MLANLLITGFGPFRGVETNSSELVVRELRNMTAEKHGFRLQARILPVVYETASATVCKAIDSTNPAIFIMTGVSNTAKELQLERVARNLDCSESCDNHETVRKNHRIVEEGPDRYSIDLPLDEYANALTEQGIPSRVSNDAGGFVCNHCYYRACHHVATFSVDCICLFVHVPDLVSGDHALNQSRILTVSSAANGILMLAQCIAQIN
ncbi:MAG: pyroglutamyl-peptidase I [Acidiferrobacterales bacterium]|nr:pyroglutamyl-peptidase I [Acidiferrobacterales bacterium]